MVQERQYTKQQIKTSHLVTASVNAKNKFTTKEDNWFIHTIHICACVLACVDIEGFVMLWVLSLPGGGGYKVYNMTTVVMLWILCLLPPGEFGIYNMTAY